MNERKWCSPGYDPSTCTKECRSLAFPRDAGAPRGPWLLAPRTFVNPGVFTGPGFAEIKPHNREGIKDGLEQLRDKKGKLRAPRTPEFLVTYLPLKEGMKGDEPEQAATEGSRPCVRVFATKYHIDKANAIAVKPKKKTASGKDKDLNWNEIIRTWTWHDLGCFKAPLEVPLKVEDASLFGMAIERYARKLFQRRVLSCLTPPKKGNPPPTLTDADIWWDELARFYAELARELDDPFYADLASELASLSREAARWDAA